MKLVSRLMSDHLKVNTNGKQNFKKGFQISLIWASAFCHRVTALIGLRWELRGKEHLEKDRACIIVANHQSSLDVLGMFNIWPVMNKCTVVAKRELFYAWPFGLAAWLAGLIFIDRVRGEKARDTLNQVNSKIKKQNIKLWVFPEGTRRNTGELHSFKKGAFHMAIDEQIPILPVVFSSYCTFLNDRKKILNAGNIIITALPALSTEGLTKDDLPELMDRVHKLMSDTFKQTSSEIVQRYASKTIKSSKTALGQNDGESTLQQLAEQKISSTSPKSVTASSRVAVYDLSTTTEESTTPAATTSQAQDIVNKSTATELKDVTKKANIQALVH
ncbi:1-acyl-sn-glycerol-3-phosphate acyltransferase beta isoform X2 [Musca domestica]|uniref:1-acyl-sn-glycerol-3-phosphate acyltransferase n=1 Tax=Musca domestica TaxID=7370 RepID=A0ABM3UXM3_MUSDO|nr:1-acyl-sn-glycerol-3-phosphate acyltransferase beta isoform X2 [Musca domestica]